MFTHYTRPTPLAWLFFIGAFLTTAGMGSWQVQRLAWKEGLIAEIEQAKAENPFTNTTLPSDAATLEKKNFWPVKLTGVWDASIEYHLAPRYYKGQLGYDVIQPLLLPDHRTVLVNRGWIPAAKKDIGTRPHSIGVGRETVRGMIRYGNERNPFTPENQQEKNVWFGRDVNEMAAFYDVKNVLPAMVDQVGERDAKALPIPSDGEIRLRNDHLSYIITWYSIALGVLVIFMLSHKKKPVIPAKAGI
jgi:surfeit locus 1 family protein